MLFAALSQAARQALRAMNLPKYEYRTEFAKRYYGQGLTEGEAKGRTELVLRQLTVRFGALPESVRARLQVASSQELDGIGERLLTAGTLSEVFDTQ